ncbi:MAG: alpha/beta hydrolase [Brachymonas sp.]|nr:alpha/beta hydrolase [Brachymonas sp.]
MKITVQNTSIYAYTGGKPFDPTKPTLMFIHGVLNDHSVWILQTRYLAHHGFNVLAVDLPGHGKSEGDCPKTVEEAAEFVLKLIDAAGVQKAALIGHSWGSLIALHAASLAPERVSQLALVGTAFPMKVSPALLDASLNQPMKAIEMVNTFSHSTIAPPPSALGPGTWLYGGSRALMRRVLASNTKENVFYTGFKACDSYEGAFLALNRYLACMEYAQSAILFIVGSLDQMTTPKAAQALIDKAPGAKVEKWFDKSEQLR